MKPNYHHEALEIIKQNLLSAYPNLIAIYLFGSFGSKYENAESDVDIALLSRDLLDSVVLWNLAQEISIKIDRDIELIDLAKSSTVFKFQVITTGSRIFCSDEKYCDKLENIYMSMYYRFNEERAEIVEGYRQKYG